MSKLFGTDGVRGVANIHPMTSEVALQLGRAVAFLCRRPRHRSRVLIGKDTRLSGYMLETAMSSGICSMGADVLLVGPLPTPGIAHLARTMRADAGVVISASHNPFQDNGIKIFSRDGFKLPDQLEETIEKLIFNDTIKGLRPTADEVGKAFRMEDANGRYIVFLKNTFPQHLALDGLKLVIDCANGAAYKIAPAVFTELGAEIITLGVNPDGKNINDGCGSLYPKKLQKDEYNRGGFERDSSRILFSARRFALINRFDHQTFIINKERASSLNLASDAMNRVLGKTTGGEDSLVGLSWRANRITETWQSADIAKDIVDFSFIGDKGYVLVRDARGEYAIEAVR